MSNVFAFPPRSSKPTDQMDIHHTLADLFERHSDNPIEHITRSIQENRALKNHSYADVLEKARNVMMNRKHDNVVPLKK